MALRSSSQDGSRSSHPKLWLLSRRQALVTQVVLGDIPDALRVVRSFVSEAISQVWAYCLGTRRTYAIAGRKQSALERRSQGGEEILLVSYNVCRLQVHALFGTKHPVGFERLIRRDLFKWPIDTHMAFIGLVMDAMLLETICAPINLAIYCDLSHPARMHNVCQAYE